MSSQTPDATTDTNEQLAQMRRDVARMEAMVQQLVSANAVENVLINGFTKLSKTLKKELQPLTDTVTAQLQPLAELAPKRTQMDDGQRKRLTKVRAELKRDIWTGAGTLDPTRPERKEAAYADHLTRS